MQPLPAPDDDERDHGQETTDLAQWTPEQRAALDLLLMGADLPHGWDGPNLVVPRARKDEAEVLIRRIRQLRAPAGPAEAKGGLRRGASSWDSIPPPGEVASAERGFIGFVIDSLVLVPATFVLLVLLFGSGHGSAVGRRVLAMTMVAAYNVVGVGRWGRTLGKRLMGTRVVAADTGRPPGWNPAIVRWAVQAAPGIVALVWISSIPLVLEAAMSVVVYAGVLRDPRRQGLHDKAAGTLVVNA